MKIKFFLIAASILSTSIASAQSVDDIMRLSSSSAGVSTSRIVSMGGAYTSLGADAGSIDINPAGLGMYRSNDYSLTLNTNTASTTTNSTDRSGVISNKINSTEFNLSNIAAIFHLPIAEYGLKNITFGLSYNRSADFHMKSFSSSAPSSTSISHLFAKQLELNGVNPGEIDNGGSVLNYIYDDQPIGLWGAVMNFNNLMVDASSNAPYKYWVNNNLLAKTDKVISEQSIIRNGNNGNFSFSMGFNVDEWLYLGMTMGARTFYYVQNTIYQEFAAQNNTGTFNELYYEQDLIMQGNAFDFKVGATIQPVTGLRIGLAYHAPKVTYVKESYSEYQDVSYIGESKRHSQGTPLAINGYNAVSAQKLLTGISYRLGSFGILSFDFVRNLNNSVKIKNINGAQGLTEMVQATIKDNNEYKVGLEIKAYRGLFIRGGFNYVESFYHFEDNNPNNYGDIRTFSAGLGYKARVFYIDLAYQNSHTLVEPYYYYGMEGILPESIIDQKITNNIVTMTLGFRF